MAGVALTSAPRDTLQFTLTRATPWDRWKYEWIIIPHWILLGNDEILPWKGKELELHFVLSVFGFLKHLKIGIDQDSQYCQHLSN